MRLTPPTCADCGSPMQLRTSQYGKFWGCARYPDCKGAHGAHPDGRPLGTPANKETKEARIRAHAAFDPLWKGDGALLDRTAAYKWLAKELGIDARECHIGNFDIAQCERVISAMAIWGLGDA